MWPYGVDPFQVGAGLKVLAIAFQDDDAKLSFLAEFIHCRQHAMNEARIIGIVNFRSIQRDRGDAALIEVPQHWIGGH
jgi:hypothetical protein